MTESWLHPMHATGSLLAAVAEAACAESAALMAAHPDSKGPVWRAEYDAAELIRRAAWRARHGGLSPDNSRWSPPPLGWDFGFTGAVVPRAG